MLILVMLAKMMFTMIKIIMGHAIMLSVCAGLAMMNIILLVLLKGDGGDGDDGVGNDGDGDHPITECSSVQWLDGLGGQV